MKTSVVLPEGVTPVDNGYRLRETDEYVVDVWRYSFNWRLVSYLGGQQITTERGYCFLGLGAVPLERAIAAGLAWEDPLHSDPPDYDKRAFPDPQWAEHLRERMQ